MAWVLVSIGSNIERYQHIGASLDMLQQRYGQLTLSSVFESVAVGFEGDNFLNMAAGFNCDHSVAELSAQLREIEYDNGRRRDGPKFGPRTLDIDILTYDDLTGVVDGIELPRDEITKNAFVLLPLFEIAPQELHPVLNCSYAELWQVYDQSKQKLWPVDFNWQGQAISKAS